MSDLPSVEKSHAAFKASSLQHKRRTFLVFVAFSLFVVIALCMPRATILQSEQDLDGHQICLGLGILACIAFLWLTEALPLAATALLVPVLATFSGIFDLKTALQPFADPLIYLFFGGFALGSALSHQKLDQWMVNQLMRWGGGRFLPVSYLLFACTAFLSMWMSNTATTALMLPIALGLLRGNGVKTLPRSNSIFLLLGIAYSAGIGGLGTIIGSPPNGIAAAKLDLNFLQWMSFGIPCVITFMPIMAWILHKACRPEPDLVLPSINEVIVFTRGRITTLIIFAITVSSWICGAWLGRTLGITHAIDSVIALTTVFVLLFTRVIGWREIERGTDWNVLLLFGGGLALSEILNHTGASTFLARMVSSQVHDAPVLLLLIVTVAFAMISAGFTSNTGSAALLIPIFYAVTQALPMDARLLVIPIALASSCSFLLPISTPPNAIVYGTGLVPQQAMIKNGFFLSFVCFLLISLATYLLR